MFSLQDCDHGTDYDKGSRVQTPPFDNIPFPFVFVTCRQCQQSEILPDLETRDQIEDYDDWRMRQIEMDRAELEDSQYQSPSFGY